MNRKYNIDIVRKIFEKEGYKLLSTKYINTITKLKCICKNNHNVEINLTNFMLGHRCGLCSLKERTFNYDYVFNYFKVKGCYLLSKTYTNSKQKLDYICECGNQAKIEFRLFKSGIRCSGCSRRRAKKTNIKNHNGKLHFQTDEFKEERKKTYQKNYGVDHPMKSSKVLKKREQNNLKKYGKKHLSQVPHIRQRQKDGLFKKYGYEYTMQIPSAKQKFKETLLRRYGVSSLAYLSNCCSKESQKVFIKIHEQLPKKLSYKDHFGTNGGEYVLSYKQKYYKYDFVNTKVKKCIEYNGSRFHPQKNQKDNEIGWCVFHPNKTVKEARQYEKLKYEALIVRGYKILTVWDKESNTNFNKLVKKCITFLLS